MEGKQEIQTLLKNNPIFLFMKGTPQEPKCGFSARVCQILSFMEVKFNTYDVLSNDIIREGIKQYAQWPTIPQLYINAEFVGGCDIIQEQFQSGELKKLLSNAKVSQ